MSARLEAEHLFKVFGERQNEAVEGLRDGATREELRTDGTTAAVLDASFTVDPGQIFVVMGLSGSGKSTLLRMLNGLLEPTAGRVLFDGRDLTALSGRDLREVRARKVSMVFQHFALFPHRSVLDNAAGPLYTGLATGRIDFQTDSWLPTTHAEYRKKYGDRLDGLGRWYGPTSLELSVPSYMKDVNSLADLKEHAAEFGGRITGIEPSAGMMGLLKDKVLRQYGKDPGGAWGEGDGVHTLARRDFTADQPEVAAWLKDFRMTEEQLTGLEARIQEAGKGKEQDAVRAWQKDHPHLVDRWVPVAGAGSGSRAAG
ncbi:glycine betaine ABC transporter substrate-binding protein [Streptomyces sp. YKOK-I1]